MLVRIPMGDEGRKIERRIFELYGAKDHNAYINAQGLWDAMPNRKEVDECDFWGWRASYGFKAEIWLGQIKTADKAVDSPHPEWGTLLLYLVDHSNLAGGGFAVVYNHNARSWQASEDKEGQKSVRYFEWKACDHAVHGWEQKNIGNCLNRYTCKGCGYAYDVDSSG